MRVLFANFGGVWEMAAGRRSLAALNLRLQQPSPAKLCTSKPAGGFPPSPLITTSPGDGSRTAQVPSGSSEMVQKTQRHRLLKQNYTGLSLGTKTQGSKRKLDFDEISPAGETGDAAKGLPTVVKPEPQDEKVATPGLVEGPRKRTLRSSASSIHSDSASVVQKGALQRVEARGKRKRFTSVPSTRHELAGKVPKIEREEGITGAVDCARTVKEEAVESRGEKLEAKPAVDSALRQLVTVSNVTATQVEPHAPSRKKGARSSVVPSRADPVAAAAPAAPGQPVYNGPYPTFARPSPEECREVAERLYKLHGSPLQFDPDRPPRRITPITDNTPKLSLSCNSDALPLGTDERLSHPSINSESGVSDAKIEDRSLVYYSPEQKLTLGSVSKDKAVVSCLCFLERSVLDSLVGTILSQNTTDANSSRAFQTLKKAFPTWEEVQKAEPDAVADAIRCAGLAARKGEHIQSILTTLLQERGEISLEHLWNMSEADIKQELGRFKGVGPKTVACVLMFHLNRDEFPVDTHVFRISKMLGWVPADADREKTYSHLNQRIPNNLKFDLHCMFVTHGRSCPNCAAGGRPRHKTEGPCPLLEWSGSFLSNQRASKSTRRLPKPGVKLIKKS